MEILLGVGTMTAGKAGITAGPEVHVHEVGSGSEAPDHDHGDGHDIGFDTWTYTADAPLSMVWLQEIITHLPSTVFRMRGSSIPSRSPSAARSSSWSGVERPSRPPVRGGRKSLEHGWCSSAEATP
jgi:hypothetical protein